MAVQPDPAHIRSEGGGVRLAGGDALPEPGGVRAVFAEGREGGPADGADGVGAGGGQLPAGGVRVSGVLDDPRQARLLRVLAPGQGGDVEQGLVQAARREQRERVGGYDRPVATGLALDERDAFAALGRPNGHTLLARVVRLQRDAVAGDQGELMSGDDR